jgi:hypothetical protein
VTAQARIAHAARGLRWHMWQEAGARTPYLHLARRRPGRAVLDAGTELVIEGFPRTGNTFATVAFQTAQPRPVPVAHHLHVASHVIAAAERGVPALVLIRPLEATVVSAMMWWQYVSAPAALRAYARFYRRLMPVRDACVVAPFHEVTSDFGAVVERINRRYGTEFARFDHTPEHVERCYRLIEERSAHAPWAPVISAYMSGRIPAAQMEAARGTPSGAAPEMRVARPSAVRDAARDGLREVYRDSRLEGLRRRAERAYSDFVGD